jgi:dihydroorotase
MSLTIKAASAMLKPNGCLILEHRLKKVYMADLLVKGGKIVTPSTVVEANLVVQDGRIRGITKKQEISGEVVDAKGLYVIPGLIDAHVHFRDLGQKQKGDWKSESRAAAAGGVTTVLDMPNNKPGINSVEMLEEKRALASEKSAVDFGLYIGAENNNLDEIKKAKNIAGVKFFLGESTGDFLFDENRLPEFFKELKKKGLLAALHCEKASLLEKYKKDKFRYFSDVRPTICETQSIRDVVRSMCDNRVHIVHVTTDAGLREVVRGKKLNKNLTCEVTPQHLWLNKQDELENGSWLKMYPPLRSKSDNSALFMGLRSGAVDIVSTDHAPHTKREKGSGWQKAPGGVPGVETRLPLVLDHTDLRGLIETCCRKPAEIFGIRDKGALIEGYDADFVLLDLNKEWEISNKDIVSKCGWTPFDGIKVKGKVKGTFVRGQQVYDGKKTHDAEGEEIGFVKEK